jgi:hypothetical protein
VNGLSVVADGQAGEASGQLVTGDYFAGLGVLPLRGRTLTAADDRADADPVAVITYRYWQRRFDRDQAIIGKAIDVNRLRVEIVGITPEGFDGIRVGESSDLTLRMRLSPRLAANGQPRSARWNDRRSCPVACRGAVRQGRLLRCWRKRPGDYRFSRPRSHGCRDPVCVYSRETGCASRSDSGSPTRITESAVPARAAFA